MKTAKRTMAAILALVMLLGVLPARAVETGTIIEAEASAPAATGTWLEKTVKQTADVECSGGKFYFLQGVAAAVGGYGEFTLTVPETGTYDIYVTTKDNKDRAIFQFLLNDEALGSPLDMFIPEEEYVGQWGTYREHAIGTAALAEGEITLRATVIGRNPAVSSTYYGGTFDCFRLVPVPPSPDPGEPGQPSDPIFFEDFEGETHHFATSADWTVVSDGTSKVLQGVSAKGGVLNQETTGLKLPQSYTISYDYTMLDSANPLDWSGGILFEYENDTSFYHCRFIKKVDAGSIQLIQWPNTKPADYIFTRDCSFETGAGVSQNMRIINDNGLARFYVNDRLVAEKIPINLSGGSLGMRAYCGTMQFDNITVWDQVVEPENPQPPEPTPELYHMKLDSEGVTKSEGWSTSSLTGSGKDCPSIYAGDVGKYVRFQPKTIKAGWYEVAFWNIAKDQATMKMTATVRTGQGDSVVQPPSMSTNGWNTVGTFYFDGMGDEYFQLTITTAGTHSRVADMRFRETTDPGYENTIWHDEGAQFTTTGGWAAAAEPKGADDSGVRKTTDISATATWSDYPPDTGRYAIYYWNPAPVEGETRAPLSFDISSLDGNWKASLNPGGKPAGWLKLCTIAATAGTATTVAMSLMGQGTAYADAIKLEKTSLPADPVYTPGSGGSDEIAVLVNQIGYDTGKPKRASVPNAVDGMSFKVVNKVTGETAFSGQVEGGVAEFTELDTDTDTEFYIVCGPAQSYGFTIGIDLIQRRSVKNALAFMSETRADVFKMGVAGIGWRDSHQFSFELNGMVLQYMANPALYDNLPYGIIETATCEYPELRTQDEPDLVWLIQFAAQRYYDWGHNDGKKLHMLTKEQLAYYLYLYPEISEYVDEMTYKAIRDYTLSVWGENACNVQWYGISGTNHDLYSVQTVFAGLKGSQPPGHSIVPNLMMYEVAKRDGLGDDVAQKFFQAAYDNCAFTIKNIDITDPFYNKGQRMSEYIAVPALAWFLEMYPTEAPDGLQTALEKWAEKTIARSDNMWDIRMAASMAAGDGEYAFHYTSGNIDKDYWTGAAYAAADKQADVLPGGTPKNEPGNQAGLQAITYAAARVLNDPATNERLTELGVAAIDDLFGRNPTKRAAFYHFTRDFEGADLGWYKQYVGGNGLLGGHTAVIDANAPELCYPYTPENYTTGYTEGWVAYNTAWNASLAYAAADAVRLSLPVSGNVGSTLKVTLRAPLNMDAARVETGTVVVTNPITREQAELSVTERSADSEYFEGSLVLPNVPYVTVSYGSGIFRQTAEVTISDFAGTPVTSITLDTESLALSTGETAALTVGVLPQNATDRRVNFSSDNPTVATVTDQGMVKAVKPGETRIVVTSLSNPGVTAACTVTVVAAAPQSLRVSAPGELSVFGAPGKIAVTGVVYSDGSVVTEALPTAAYSTGNNAILKVETDGTLTALTAGTATVTATATVEGKTIAGSAKVTVTAETAYDFLTLYRADQYTTDGVSTMIAGNTKDDLTASYGPDRLKLTGNQAGNRITFSLGNLPAGTYDVTLYSKYFGGNWAYGVWSFQVDGKAVGQETNFDQADKNGAYHDVPLGQVTLEGTGPHTFTFLSSNGGSLVPISVRLNLAGGEAPDPDPDPDLGQTEPKIHTMDGMYKKVYTDTATQAGGLNYRLYIPAGYTHDQAGKLPMLIYLNGAGSRGTDNTKQLANLSPLITPLIDNADYPCVIVVPQLPSSDKWVNVDWANGSYSTDVAESNSAKLLMGLIGELKTAYKVDEDRVYLMGQSFGGYGTWDLITRHPETFAAAIPMCGSACLARADAVKDMPLLVLHGAADPTVPVKGSQEMVAALRAAGSDTITYLEYEGDDHYVQRRLFEQPELYMDWLFAQKRGTPAQAPDVSGCYMPKLTLNLNKSDQLDRLTVTGGTAVISGEQLLLTPETEGASALALVKDTGAFADGMLTTHFTMDALTGSGGAGLVLRARDDQNYVHLRFTKSGLNLLEMVSGAAKRNDTVPYTLTGNRITCMRAELRGSALKVWVDNVLLYNTTIQTPALQVKGALGARSYAVAAKVDDLIWAKQDGVVIALDSMAERQVYQRKVETKNAAVPLSGTAEGAVSLRARVVSWDDENRVVHDWTDLALGGKGAFAATVTIPQGGWYQTQFEALGGSGKKTTAKSGRWGVGINILCIGQSNMVGIGQGQGVVADDLASNFMNEQWTHLVDPYDKGDSTPISSDGSVGNSMVPTLANALIAEYGVPVGIIPAAKGGAGLVCDCSSYPRWLDRTEGNPADRSNLYGNSIYRAKAAGGIELILMNQGEHDVSAGTGEAEYLEALNTLIGNYRRDLGWKVPFFYCQLGAAKAGSWGNDRGVFMDGIRAAQAKANDPANGVILAAAELDLGRNSDNLHYTTESQKVIGARVANAIAWYYNADSAKKDYYTGPSISSVRFSGETKNQLEVTITHGGGNDIAPATGITGFEVTDAGEAVEISSAVRKDRSTILLTLTRPAVGEAKLRYMSGLLPDVTGLVKDNSPLTLPLNVTAGWLTVAESGAPIPIGGRVAITGEAVFGERLTADVTGITPTEANLAYVWTRAGSEMPISTQPFYVPAEADMGKTLALTVSGAGEYSGSLSAVTATVERAEQSAPDGVGAVAETDWMAGDGKITGVTPAMEYRAENNGVWSLIVGTVVERLSPGKYQVRYALTDTHKAGEAVTVEIEACKTPPSGSAITATTTKNGDGSITKTVKNAATGKVVSTTTYPSGAKVVATTPKNGSTTAQVTLPDGQGPATVLLPLPLKPTAGTVAVILREDGTEEIIKYSVAAEKGIRVTLSGNALLMIKDNTKRFADVPESYLGDEGIYFVAARELFNGIGGGLFAPEIDMTRGMVLTVLYRLGGAPEGERGATWYSAAQCWAVENRLSSGDDMEKAVTREQLAVLLYRYSGSPEAEWENTAPGDTDRISPWALDAVEWAVEEGLLIRKDDGALSPQGTITRTETADAMRRFILYFVR